MTLFDQRVCVTYGEVADHVFPVLVYTLMI